MYFYDGELIIQETDICFTCERVNGFRCPIFTLIEKVAVYEDEPFEFDLCEFKQGDIDITLERHLKVIK